MTRYTEYFSLMLMIIGGLTFSHISFGNDFYNSDPYEINFTRLNIEQTRSEVVKYKIKSVTSKQYSIKKNEYKHPVPKSSFYTVEFNDAGNPVKYMNKFYRINRNTNKMTSITNNYLFEYDAQENLIHIKEYEFHFSTPESHFENDVYFFYNKSNNLIEQIVSKKCIYNSEYRNGGSRIPNDTSLTKFLFNYDASKKVNSVFKDEYYSRSKIHWLDTLTFNCSFDSIFIEKSIPRGIKKDNEGRIIENTSYARHLLLKSGECISPDSPADVITEFYYDKNGKLVKSLSRSRNGDFNRTKYWAYNEKGLLESKQVENSKKITMYEYEFY